ncbi:MAG: monovalent cation/H(+) antiporter subunit G [Pseudomonadota bacterium]
MAGEVIDLLLAVKPWVGSFLLLVGAIMGIIGAIGMLRFPDVYTRVHAASVIDTGAMTVAIVGMLLLAPTWTIAIKLAAIWLFLFITGPTSSHALINAAYKAGLQPLIGAEARKPRQSDGGAS